MGTSVCVLNYFDIHGNLICFFGESCNQSDCSPLYPRGCIPFPSPIYLGLTALQMLKADVSAFTCSSALWLEGHIQYASGFHEHASVMSFDCSRLHMLRVYIAVYKLISSRCQ